MKNKRRRNAINLADIISWWEGNHGEERAGHFNIELYLDILRIKNQGK
jgi:hypothetical protein